VVFVCTENSARSQLAEALWNEICPIKATSAGITPAAQVHRGAIRAAARHGLDLSRSHPKHLPKISDGDLIISVCDRARDVLVRRKEPRQLHWSVPDPVPSNSSKAFDLAVEVIANRVSAIAPRIMEPDGPGAR
jgi:protein-tyrosine-phosphatase